MFNNIGLTEILVIVLILMVFFGSNKLSSLARGLGEATLEIKNLKKNIKGTKEDNKSVTKKTK